MRAVLIGAGSRGIQIGVDPINPAAPDHPASPPDRVAVTVTVAGLSATHDVHTYPDFRSLTRFFAELARDWRGWSGERTYASLEGDLEIRATHTGHVVLRVRLTSHADDWEVTTTVRLDPGEDLTRVVDGLTVLLGS